MKPRDVPVRFSRLKHMAQSPAHYLASLEDRRDTGPMLFGRACHSAVLGGSFAVYDGERRGKAWESFKAEHDGEDIITATEHDRVRRVADAVAAHPLAARLLTGDRELPIAWERQGRACSSRLDCLGASWVADLKTSNTSEPNRFGRMAIRMGYHAQLAWYQDAARFIGRAAPDAFLVAVETSAPYAVTVMQLTSRALEEGRKLCRIWFERLLTCEEVDVWPGYCESAVDLDVPEELDLLIDGEEVAA